LSIPAVENLIHVIACVHVDILPGSYVLLLLVALLKTLLWLMIVGVPIVAVSTEVTSHVMTGILY